MNSRGNIYHALPLWLISAVLAILLSIYRERYSAFARYGSLSVLIGCLLAGVNLTIPRRRQEPPKWGDKTMDDYRLYLKNLPKVEPPYQETGLLEEAYDKLTDHTVQLLMRDCNPADIATALAGASGRVRLRFIENLGSRGGMMLVDDIAEAQKRETADTIREKQRQLLKMMEES